MRGSRSGSAWRRRNCTHWAPGVRRRETSEHDPEKWAPVFRKRSCSTNNLKRDDDSKRSHHALVVVAHQAEAEIARRRADRAAALDGIADEIGDIGPVRAFDHAHA